MFGLTMDGTSFPYIICILFTICVSVYGYLEIKRLKMTVSSLEKTVKRFQTQYTPPNHIASTVQPETILRPQAFSETIKSHPVEISKPTLAVKEPVEVKESMLVSQEPVSEVKEPELANLMLSDEEEDYDNYDLSYKHTTPDRDSSSEVGVSEPPVEISSNPNEGKEDIKIIQAEAEDPEYSSKTISELKAILTEMNQPVSGNKTKLIKRIREHTIVNKV